METRAVLEPMFVKAGVSVVLTGHDHFYERIKLAKGIQHFVVGAGGSLRKGDIRTSDITAKGFDSDYSFMIAEIDGDDMHYQAISRKGVTSTPALQAGGVARMRGALRPPRPRAGTAHALAGSVAGRRSLRARPRAPVRSLCSASHGGVGPTPWRSISARLRQPRGSAPSHAL